MFAPRSRDQVAVYRTFPPADPIAMSSYTKRVFDRIARGSSRVDPRSVAAFRAFQLFESAEVEAARRDLFQHHVDRHRAIAIPAHAGELAAAPIQRHHEIDGLLVPHGDPSLVGAQVARALSHFSASNWPDLFVIGATSHYVRELSVLTHDVRIGGVRAVTDRAFVERVTRALGRRMTHDSHWFLHDHSWQVFLPLFTRYALGNGLHLKIAAMLIPRLAPADLSPLAEAIQTAAVATHQRVCFVASGDLSHVGYGYARDPSISLTRRDSRGRVLDRVKRSELPVLAALCSGERRDLSRLLPRTSFCARSQVEVLQRYTELPGTVLGHAAFLNFRRSRSRELAVPFRETDRIYSTATVLFGRARDAGERDARPYLCPRLYLQRRSDTLRILHLCDRSQFEGPAALLELMSHLREHASTDLATLGRVCGFALDQAQLDGALASFRTRGIVFHRDAGNLAFRRELAWEQFIAAAPRIHYYESGPFRSWSDVPRIDAAVVRQHWDAFFVEPRPKYRRRSRRYDVRTSSASSGGARLTTVVEPEVRDQRERVPEAIGAASGPTLLLNRPENTIGTYDRAGPWPILRVVPGGLLASPGEDLHPIDERAWLEVAARAQALAPATIQGSPEHVAVFAHVLDKHGLALPSVRHVELGHNHAWSPYVRRIRARFRDAVVTRRLHSSELGTIAIECDHQRLHLVERNKYIELLNADGEPAADGELAEPLYTTLDTQLRPMFRYSQGDLLIWRDRPCPCGTPGRIVEFQGRTRDVVLVDRAYVTYPMLDACLADVEPCFVFQLVISKHRAVLNVGVFERAARSAFPAAAVAERLADLVQRDVRVTFRNQLHAQQPGKLLGVVNNDRRQSWALRTR